MYNPRLMSALEGVKKAVRGEREDELFYDYLISEAPDEGQKEVIASIRDDERRHNRVFRKIYKEFTGMEVTMAEEETFQRPKSYLEGIKKALFGELSAVERYRKIRKGLPMLPYRDLLFDIITDELKHASKYNYLFTVTSEMCRGTRQTQPEFTPDDWVEYITPLVERALAETKEGINPQHLYQEFILSGVLVGLGYTPEDAIRQVEDWEKTGESKLLAASKMGMSKEQSR
ncbi:MAG: ferritin-like domain-containing protein [Clostridiaceae bacterium]